MRPFYITTTLPYVNAEPHIGFALEIIAADVLARYHALLGDDVVFNTGTDEHGLKIFQEAQKKNVTPQEYVDGYAAKFKALASLLHLSVTHFVRTTDPHHIVAAQTFWNRCLERGDIYKKQYKVKYCVGCELEKTESELVDGHCPLHPTKDIEIIEEENYFFRFSKFQQPLLAHFANHPDFVQPESKMRAIVAFVEHGLEDFSVSRLKTKMPWGIPVPHDPDQVMYVWFDALINYISTLGWPEDMDRFNQFWPGVQIAGKDNLRQQSSMWQAMLMSAELPCSKQVLINGFISVEGQKMSKSLGNVISPTDMVNRYGIDGTRYILMSLGPVNTDMDISWKQFDTLYNGFLANSLGNTVQRIATLAHRAGIQLTPAAGNSFTSAVVTMLESYRFAEALGEIWKRIAQLEKHIDDVKPWTLSGDPLQQFLIASIVQLQTIGYDLSPFMPETASAILALFGSTTVDKPTPLFPRLATT
jgi:methionyl-tRNA synthetase